MSLKKHKSLKRRANGMAAVELACGSLFLLVLTFLAIDVTILMLGYELNDRACRDACRAAAQQSTPTAAQNAATTILKTHKADGNFVSDPTLILGAGNFQYQDFGGNPTAGNPTVTITTECRVKTPVPLTFVGSVFGQDASGNNVAWTFRKRYTFPIVTFNLVLP
jgi:Flp pilus assembly protein TadG